MFKCIFKKSQSEDGEHKEDDRKSLNIAWKSHTVYSEHVSFGSCTRNLVNKIKPHFTHWKYLESFEMSVSGLICKQELHSTVFIFC